MAEESPGELTRPPDERDLVTEASGVGFEEVQSLIDWAEIDGVRIPFAGAGLLLRMKQQSVREKDVMDRRFLEGLKRDRS